ncbi:MAG: YqeG family HAD IIIA-type phosphatase [Prochloraceae cyanobacterium]|nr:YqeG family HAD IIIA-type phosphatase [Prochloraceae cyanobacterium]
MSKAAILQPDLVLGGPIVELSPEILEKNQLKGLILDVDETLVPLREKDVSSELLEWVKPIKQVAAISLVSNNLSENRIGRIARDLEVPYFIRARKPSRRKLRQALEGMNLPVSEVAMVGDRLFTDVLAGNRLGMFTILVEPMVDPAKIPNSYPLRNLEVWLSRALGVSLSGRK